MHSDESMTRGQLATATGVGVETIRFYEQKGMIPKPERTASGYRKYSGEYVVRIRFIKRAQDLGFTLKEILELLSLRIAPDSDRVDVRGQVNAKLKDIELKIADLRRIKTALSELVSCCSGRGSTHECPILEFMESQ